MSPYSIPQEDCLIVRAFRDSPSLREAAKSLHCDPSALVRKAQRISTEHGLIHKIKGRWTVTEKGLSIVRWTEETILSQRAALEARPRIRFATNTWLSERVFVPGMQSLVKSTQEKFDWLIQTPKGNFEEEIISGRSDFCTSCQPPLDPAIALKRVAKERWAVVYPAAWKKELHGLSAAELKGWLANRSFVRHCKLSPSSLLGGEWGDDNSTIQFDHLPGVRAAVANGLGWSCLPVLMVRQEVSSGMIGIADAFPAAHESDLYVWWLRGRKELSPLAKQVCNWVSTVCRE